MNIIIPQNIYSALFALSLPDNLKENVLIKESSLIVKELEKNRDDVGLIPSFDLLLHPEIFISDSFAISFDGILSNSYLYFIPEQKSFNKILLRGDIASNDLMLSKILFPEQYGIEPELAFDTKPIDFENNNYLVIGMENDVYPVTNNGISFADHIAELIDFPYVNFVLASYNEESLKQVNENIKSINEKIDSKLPEYLNKLQLNPKLNDFVQKNIQSLYYDFTDNEKQALKELLQLPYYHAITENLVDIKFSK
ncbi:MAG: hypothetical protein KKF62_07615 [Bacteroidetes bacterium]|nr:hypothetical protein [Bacteroidota bacterium]MBU1115987.1 hypothetical protein [Bacteroidota bacterium]MBU1798416.1 hypothetical protein [Bacteroidota bacterium]